MKVYFLGNYTQNLVSDTFIRFAKAQNFDITVYTSGFNQYRQEIINPNSPLYRHSPDVVFLSVDLFTLTEDIIYLNAKNLSGVFEERISDFLQLLKTLDENLTGTQIFIDNFFFFRPVTMATIEYNSPFGYLQLENIANTMLTEMVAGTGNLKIVNVKSLVDQKGAENLFDERMHYLAKSHWSQKGLQDLAGLYLRYFKAYKGIRKKIGRAHV